jgi:large subunit ribosomal protein L23
MTSFDIIKTVHVSEKAAVQSERFNQYTVVADPRANKTQIRNAVEELFKVKVIAVNTSQVAGKARRKRTKHAGRDAHWKKAIVTLKDGDKINLA